MSVPPLSHSAHVSSCSSVYGVSAVGVGVLRQVISVVCAAVRYFLLVFLFFLCGLVFLIGCVGFERNGIISGCARYRVAAIRWAIWSLVAVLVAFRFFIAVHFSPSTV